MSSFKVTISLQADLSSHDLAQFFTALAKSEQGDSEALLSIMRPVPTTTPVVAIVEPQQQRQEQTQQQTQQETQQQTPPTPVSEPPVTDALKKRLMSTEISYERLNTIIRRHNWARGQKAQIERKWGFSKAACFARIGLHFSDYSLMDGSVSTEDDLRRWTEARNFTSPL